MKSYNSEYPVTLRAWAVNNRPVCISNECTTSNELQLETQSTRIGCGCSVHSVPALHVPFICVDKLVPGMKVRCTDDSPHLAEPDMASNPTTDANELSIFPTRDPAHTDQPKRRAPSNGHGRTSSPSSLAQLGSHTTAEDFQKGLSRCSASPGGTQPSQHILQLGDSGVSILFQCL